MSRPNSATEQFLLAAKQSEIHSLTNLASNCEVVTAVSELIHQLQRERGISNIFLASKGQRFGYQRKLQIEHSDQCEHQLRQLLKAHYLDTDLSSGTMRLFNGVAFVLQGLDNLHHLRQQVDQLDIDASDTTRALSRLISGLLSVVFEAADIAAEPAVTRALVAMFNFMQGKEYAGQERAWAAIGLAEGQFDSLQCDRLLHLQEAQRRSFDVFYEFATPEEQQLWQQIESSEQVQDFVQLRSMINRLGQGDPVSPEISEVWYDLATRRIDLMKGLEDELASALLRVSQKQVVRAKQNLQQHRQQLQTLATVTTPSSSPLTMLYDPEVPSLYGSGSFNVNELSQGFSPELARSIYDLVKGQAEHLKQVSHELNEARRALRERKLIERAKGLLMHTMGMSEEQAHRTMQQRAMELNSRLVDVAQTLIDASEQAAAKSKKTL